MNWMLEPYRRYADFSGRSRRKEFWMFALFCWLVSMALLAVFGHPVSQSSSSSFNYGYVIAPGTPGYWINNIFSLVSFIPSLAVGARRLHDTDRSGWWQLLWFVPVLGWLVLLVFYCLDGTPGDNRFGPDPKGRGAQNIADIFS